MAHNGRFGPYLKTRDRHPQPGQRGPAASPSRSTRPRPCSPSPSSGRGRAGGAPRCASSATDPATDLPVVVQGGALRALRDRRHDQRLAAQGRRRRVDRPSSGRRSCWPSAGPPGPRTRKKKAGQEGRRPRRRPRPRRPGQEGGAAKKAAAKKAAAKKATGAKKAARPEGGRPTKAAPTEPFVTCRPGAACIALEGIDGCGKSTQAAPLAAALGAAAHLRARRHRRSVRTLRAAAARPPMRRPVARGPRRC